MNNFSVKEFVKVFSNDGKELGTYDKLEWISQTRCKVLKDGKWGVIDSNGEIILECIYDEIAECYGEFIKAKKGGAYGLMLDSLRVCRFLYNDIRKFSEGLAAVRSGDKWGFFKEGDELFVGCKFEEVSDFKNGFAQVKMAGLWGFINNEGIIIQMPFYDRVFDFKDGYAIVESNEQFGVIDTEGNTVIECFYKSIVPIGEDAFVVTMTDGKRGIIAKTREQLSREQLKVFEQITRFEYDAIGKFQDGVAIVAKKDETGNFKYGFINRVGVIITECIYDEARGFKNGYAQVKQNGKYGFINHKGEPVCDCKYEWIDGFTDGYARVKLGEKYGLINLKDEPVCEFKYDWVTFFENGYARADIAGKSVYINEQGQEFESIKTA